MKPVILLSYTLSERVPSMAAALLQETNFVN
jgi:hypothetical protein